MPKFESLSILGYNNRPVPHAFLRQEQPSRHLAILYPGIGYTASMPLLYYPAQLLLARGADVLRVETSYVRQPEYMALPDQDQQAWLRADALAACQAGLAQGGYDRLTLIGKSLGTLAMGSVLAAELELPGLECIWLTPLLRNPDLRRQFQPGGRQRRGDLLVIGTADSHYHPAYWNEAIAARHAENLVIPDADHSLELPGNLSASLLALQKIMAAIEAFLMR